jgi:hypothetical protein
VLNNPQWFHLDARKRRTVNPAQIKLDLGRHIFGVAAIIFGAMTWFFHDVDIWPQTQMFGSAAHAGIVYLAATVALAGGIAIEWRGTARIGAAMIGAVYLFSAMCWVPRIFQAPLIYDRWGNFFEPFSIFAAALIVYGSMTAPRVARIGVICLSLSVISFALEQAFYLSATAGFVPKWVPAGQMFWAVATTIAFLLAAAAILSGRSALLAARLLTVMLLLFGLIVWVPTLFADAHSLNNRSETLETFWIAAAAWVLADYLGTESDRKRRGVRPV